MVRRFTVIQGGLSEAPAPSADLDPVRPEAWRIDVRRPGAATDPLRDPNPISLLAQQRPAGHLVAVALAWSRDADTGREALRGVLPLAIPHPIRGGQTRFRQPEVAEAAALVENAAAEAVDRALRLRLGGLPRPVRASGPVTPERAPTSARPRLAACRAAGSRPIPAGDLIGIRPAGWERPAAAISPITEPTAMRDAVETFLTLDARTARRSISADPAETALVRVVNRLFARRGAFVRRAGAIVAGTLHLGTGTHAAAWRRARA